MSIPESEPKLLTWPTSSQPPIESSVSIEEMLADPAEPIEAPVPAEAVDHYELARKLRPAIDQAVNNMERRISS